MVQKARGFLQEARVFVEDEHHLGLSAPEIVKALLKTGRVKSVARNPVGSLVATLNKHHHDIKLERRREGGVYRYYPVASGQPPSKSTTPDFDETVSIRLPKDRLEVADLLVEVGQHKSRSEALAWLVAQGILNNQPRIEKVKKAVEQIRAIKEGIAV